MRCDTLLVLQCNYLMKSLPCIPSVRGAGGGGRPGFVRREVRVTSGLGTRTASSSRRLGARDLLRCRPGGNELPTPPREIGSSLSAQRPFIYPFVDSLLRTFAYCPSVPWCCAGPWIRIAPGTSQFRSPPPGTCQRRRGLQIQSGKQTEKAL